MKMEKTTLKLNLKYAFENLKYRDRHALILVRNASGKYILGGKSEHYPKGIVRLIGGGLHKSDTPEVGAAREVEEELNVKVLPESLKGISEIFVDAETAEGHYTLTTYLYFLQLETDELAPGDDVTEIIEYSREEIRELADRYEALTEGFWVDYGKVYGPIHRIAYEAACLK